MNVLFLRTNRIDPDPRVEKEVGSLQELPGVQIGAVVWDRGEKYKCREKKLKIGHGEISVTQFGVPATWGGGMKKNLLPMVQFEWKLFWWLMCNNKKYNMVHACDLLTGLPALFPCTIFKKKMVYDIFDFYAATQNGPSWILNLFKKLEYHVIRKADAVIICSEKRTEQIEGAAPKKLVVLHNAPSLTQLNAEGKVELQSKKSDVMRIAYVGNLVTDRYLMECLEAVKSLDNVELHIGGYGVLEKQIKEDAQKDERIFFYGKLSYDQVISLEKQCDVMIALYDPKVPNHAYAAPNKFYEALALGKPLVMFKNTGMDEVIRKNDIGYVCKANTQSITEAFKTLYARREEFDVIATKEKELFQKQYCWEIMGERLKELYREI